MLLFVAIFQDNDTQNIIFFVRSTKESIEENDHCLFRLQGVSMKGDTNVVFLEVGPLRWGGGSLNH